MFNNWFKRDQPLPGTFTPSPYTPPVAANFAWRNQTSNSVTATLTTGPGFMTIKAPAQAVGQAPRIQEMSLPAAPWTVTAAFDFCSFPGNFWDAGLILLLASTGKHIQFGAAYSTNGLLQVVNNTDLTTFSATAQVAQLGDFPGMPRFLRIADDSTNWIFSYSNDNRLWQPFLTEARNTFVTNPDKIGWFANSLDASHDQYTTLLSWVGP